VCILKVDNVFYRLLAKFLTSSGGTASLFVQLLRKSALATVEVLSFLQCFIVLCYKDYTELKSVIIMIDNVNIVEIF